MNVIENQMKILTPAHHAAPRHFVTMPRILGQTFMSF